MCSWRRVALARVFAIFALRSLGEGGPGTKLVEHYECRGTKLIEARKLSRYIGALLRADVRVRMQRPLQICLRCRVKAKSVTNNLPILSVLCLGVF
jgi:hypothetical protein